MINGKALPATTASTTQHNKWRFESIHNPIWDNVKCVKGKNVSEETNAYQTQCLSSQTRMDLGEVYGSGGNEGKGEMDTALLDAVSQKIVLTELEEKIVNLLLDVKREYELSTVLRIAGGWVRNKLLGRPGEDVDIALDDMMGTQFAGYVAKYEKLHGMEQRGIGVIKANPDQSKHLESATTHIFDEPIDFVNLRSESYAEDSRIPTAMQLGTPEQDAYRRDLTINALFYNLNTKRVEDATNRGIQDLQNGIVRTPLHPLQTFLDDPLRVLRSVRFACTYNFLVADEIFDAAHDVNVARALATKVSRERVGVELSKILKGQDPVGGFALMDEMRIRDIVFTVSSVAVKAKRNTRIYENPKSLEWTDDQWNNALFRMRTMQRQTDLKRHERMILMLASALSPIVKRDTNYDELVLWCENILCSSLRLPTKLAVDVATVIFNAFRISPILLSNTHSMTNANEIVDLYRKMIVQNIVQIGNWLRAAKELYPLISALGSMMHTTGTEFTESSNIFVDRTEQTNAGVTIRGNLLLQVLGEFDLAWLIDMRPLLKGNDICKLLDMKPGPALKNIIEKMIEWQMKRFQQPPTVEEAKQWLTDNKEEFAELMREDQAARKNKQRKKQKI